MTAPTYACDGVLAHGAGLRCKRRATVSHLLRSGRYVRYCAQHDSGAGVMRMLRPYPWDVVSTVATRDEV